MGSLPLNGALIRYQGSSSQDFFFESCLTERVAPGQITPSGAILSSIKPLLKGLAPPRGPMPLKQGGASMSAEFFQRIVRVLGFAIP